MRLLVVESPTKAGKIRGFLGPGWRVEASMGHVRDLPAVGALAITFTDGHIVPGYVALEKSSRAIAAIRAAARMADEVWLASDPDREGEAIAWHVAALLAECGKPIQRVVFHAITKAAVTKAMQQPRAIDQHLVDAQQARRVMDRVVGWAVSPTLRSLGKDAKSAGRVQSVALRMVAERETEIQAFKPVTYFLLAATLRGQRPPQFVARLWEWKGEAIAHRLGDAATAEKTVAWCRKQTWLVHACVRNERKANPPPPFTTASVQQAASVALKLAPAQSMKLLQELFEAGHITYHRTDSTFLEPEALALARAVIEREYADCLPPKPIIHANKSANAQEAHEAIRPTNPASGPSAVSGATAALYTLIWTRFIACQMAPGHDAVTTIDVACAPTAWNGGPMGIFRAKGVVRLFDGWRRLGRMAEDESIKKTGSADLEAESEAELPRLEVGAALTLKALEVESHSTKPPPRYTLAGLIKRLERDGIGRPSTYAAITTTLLTRGYIREEKRLLHATPLGRTIVHFLVTRYAGDFIEYDYTARMESALDRIADGSEAWEPLITRAARRVADLAMQAGLRRDPLAAS